ncbi:MAG: RNA polymerase sporulation sigma factor SigE [Monoglobales bacterium]
MNYKALIEKIRALLGINNLVYYIGGSDVLPAPLSREEEDALMLRLDTEPELVRKTLIEHNLRLVVYIAKKFESSGVGVEDLVSIGTIGLIKAINTFKPDKKIKLATYASRCIENEMLMHLRKISNIRTEVSIEEPLNTDWDGNELLLSDILGTDNDIISRNIEEETDRSLLHDAIRKLPKREQQIMELRFGLMGNSQKTQKEVADMLGISQSYISRLEKKILDRLKKEISGLI